MEWTEQKLSEELNKHQSWLMEQPGVTGVGIGLSGKGMALQIMTDHLDAESKMRFRQRLGEVPVEYVSTGPIDAL